MAVKEEEEISGAMAVEPVRERESGMESCENVGIEGGMWAQLDGEVGRGRGELSEKGSVPMAAEQGREIGRIESCKNGGG
jgi:hypothetical protein